MCIVLTISISLFLFCPKNRVRQILLVTIPGTVPLTLVSGNESDFFLHSLLFKMEFLLLVLLYLFLLEHYSLTKIGDFPV